MDTPAVITGQFIEALLRLDPTGAAALLAGLPPQPDGPARLEDVVVSALEHIGRAWEEGDLSLSQVYVSGRICEQVMEQLLPGGQTRLGQRPRLAIGVLADYHALGKRMVKSALHAAGFQVLDYGAGRRPAQLVAEALRDDVDVLLVSCLMLASAVQVREVVQGLRQAGSPAAVVVGGAPFRLAPQLWREVGAQAMGRNSAEAVGIVQTLAEERTWT